MYRPCRPDRHVAGHVDTVAHIAKGGVGSCWRLHLMVGMNGAGDWSTAKARDGARAGRRWRCRCEGRYTGRRTGRGGCRD